MTDCHLGRVAETGPKAPDTDTGTGTYTGTGRARLRRLLAPLAIAAGTLTLGGCAAPVIGAITISQLATAAGVASSIMSGRDLGEHMVSSIVGQDCRFLEAVLRGRPICVPYGSPEADESFQGIIVALGDGRDTPSATARETRVAGLDPDAVQLGFAPIVPDYDIRTGAIAAVEQDIHDSRRGDLRRVSFGMMSATYGPSHSMDDLIAQRSGKDARPFIPASEASAAPRPILTSAILASAAPSGVGSDSGAPSAGPTPLAARRSDGQMISPDLPATRAGRIEGIISRAQMAPIGD